MIRSKLTFLTITALLLVFFNNCSENSLYKSEIELPNEVWTNDHAATFKPTITDTSQLFDINLEISNSNDYRFSNIWFFIRSVSPQGFSQTDTVEIILAEDDGKWIGKKESDLYTLDIKYKERIRFPKTGNYTFEIIQGMRDLELKGISKLGFRLQKSI
jgi:gliding motility-associated lipoprotein GldH